MNHRYESSQDGSPSAFRSVRIFWYKEGRCGQSPLRRGDRSEIAMGSGLKGWGRRQQKHFGYVGSKAKSLGIPYLIKAVLRSQAPARQLHHFAWKSSSLTPTAIHAERCNSKYIRWHAQSLPRPHCLVIVLMPRLRVLANPPFVPVFLRSIHVLLA